MLIIIHKIYSWMLAHNAARLEHILDPTFFEIKSSDLDEIVQKVQRQLNVLSSETQRLEVDETTELFKTPEHCREFIVFLQNCQKTIKDNAAVTLCEFALNSLGHIKTPLKTNKGLALYSYFLKKNAEQALTWYSLVRIN